MAKDSLKERLKGRRQSENVLDIRTDKKKALEHNRQAKKENMDMVQRFNTRIRSDHPLTHTADVQTILKNNLQNSLRRSIPEEIGKDVMKRNDLPSQKLEKIDSDKQPAIHETTTDTYLPEDRGTDKKRDRIPEKKKVPTPTPAPRKKEKVESVKSVQVTPGKWETINKGKK